MEPGTGIVTALGVWASKDLISKLLGPTADYLGEGLRNFTEHRANNLRNIFDKAAHRLGPKIESPGVINPRVLIRVIEDGQFCEDELYAEYYGGVLAASRGDDPSDDRALPFIDLIRSMSVYELRTHYVFSRTVRFLYEGSDLVLNIVAERQELSAYIPSNSWAASIGLNNISNNDVILNECYHGLGRRGLIDRNALLGRREFLVQRGVVNASAAGIRYMLMPFGAGLMLWASGYRNLTSHAFLYPDVQLMDISEINLPTDVKTGKLTNS